MYRPIPWRSICYLRHYFHGCCVLRSSPSFVTPPPPPSNSHIVKIQIPPLLVAPGAAHQTPRGRAPVVEMKRNGADATHILHTKERRRLRPQRAERVRAEPAGRVRERQCRAARGGACMQKPCVNACRGHSDSEASRKRGSDSGGGALPPAAASHALALARRESLSERCGARTAG